MIKKYKIFFDMDEIIYNLSDLIRKYVNNDFHKNYPEGFNKSYWWADYKNIPQPYFQYLLNRKGTFYEGEPVKDSIKIINKLYNEKYNIHVLTQPQINQYCFYEKAMFLQKHLPWLDLNSNFHCSGNKGLFAYSKYTRNILIDDDMKHLTNWRNNGGIAICFSKGWNKKWGGYKVDNFNELYKLIHEITDKEDE